jgi:DNA-binding SARP family transcriptional activator
VVTIRLFGHALYEDGANAAPFRAPARAIALVAYLITHRDAPIARNYLAELLWPHDDLEAGRAKLRRHLHVLTQALPPAPAELPYFLTTMQALRWNPAAPAVVDVITFADAARDGRFDDAVAWYGGEFLESFYDDWVIAERERLRALQLDVLRSSIARKRGERDLAGALADVGRMLAIDPWREDALRVEMAVRVQLGDRSGALAAYRAFAERLRAELDVDPALETRAAYDAHARGEAAGDAPAAERAIAAPAATPQAMPFTGRSVEFERLTQAWSAAAYGRGSMVLIGGESGNGKSRLAQELALHVEGQGGAVLVGTTSPGEARPYEAMLDALRGALSLVVAALDAETIAVLARVLPEIAASSDIADVPARVAEAERQRTFEAIHAALAVVARKRPLLIVLEDLHWTSAASIALLEHVVRRIAGSTVLVIGTYRDEEVGRAHPLRAMRRRLETEGSLAHIGLARLGVEDIAAIVARAVPERAGDAAFARELFAFSEGVPLFLEESLRAGTLRGERLDIAARIERLPEGARIVLEIAAVAGAGFNLDVVGEVSGWSESEMLRGLDVLVEARFVRESRRRRLGDYAFAHHLVHAAVYAEIPDVVRRRRHALIARASEMLAGERADAALEIARHYDRAGDAERATIAYLRAAEYAHSLFANEELLAITERALELASADELLVELYELHGWAAVALGDGANRARAVAALGELPIAARHVAGVERLRATHAMFEGRFDEARAACDRFLAAAADTDDGAFVAAAHLECAMIASVSDRYADAEDHLERARGLIAADDEGAGVRLLRAQTFLAQRRGEHGAELRAGADRLLAGARRAGEPQFEAEAHVRLAHADIAGLDFAAARTHFDAAADAYRRSGSPRGIDSVQNNSANLALWMADYAAAEALYQSCFAFAVSSNDEANLYGCSIGLTLAAIYRNDLAAASERLERVAGLERPHQTVEDANGHLCRALIAAESGRFADAAAAYDASLAIHRAHPPNALLALTLAAAVHGALDAGDTGRGAALDAELAALSEALLCAEEFPHLMYWARSRAVQATDAAGAGEFLARAERLYRERTQSMNPLQTAAFAAVPWNARFLTALSDAFQTLRT